MSNTTRSHPRTLNDAFKGVDYGCAIERPRPADRAVAFTLLVAIIFISALLYFGARP